MKGEPKKRTKPALMCTSLRLPKDVVEYFTTKYPYRKQAKIREILTEYVNNELNQLNKTK